MVVTWGLSLVILGINAFLVAFFSLVSDLDDSAQVFTSMSDNLPSEIWVYALVLLFGIVYFSFVLRLIKEELRSILHLFQGRRKSDDDDTLEPLIGGRESKL